MKRPLLLTAATATLVVGAVCGIAAHAYATEPSIGHTTVSAIKALTVPENHQPTGFAPSTGGMLTSNGEVRVAAHDAVDLDAPSRIPLPDDSGSTIAAPTVSEQPGLESGATPGQPASVPAAPPVAPKPTYGNNGNGNDNGKGTGNGKGNSSGKSESGDDSHKGSSNDKG